MLCQAAHLHAGLVVAGILLRPGGPHRSPQLLQSLLQPTLSTAHLEGPEDSSLKGRVGPCQQRRSITHLHQLLKLRRHRVCKLKQILQHAGRQLGCSGGIRVLPQGCQLLMQPAEGRGVQGQDQDNCRLALPCQALLQALLRPGGGCWCAEQAADGEQGAAGEGQPGWVAGSIQSLL